MDLLFEAFMRFGSYFMITYFAYSIFGRNKKVAYAIYALLFISIGSSFLRYINGGAPSNILMIAFMVELFPLFVAFFFFARITGLRINKRFIRTKTKVITPEIQPKFMMQLTLIGLILFAIVFGSGSYFFVENWMKWVILTASGITLVFSAYLFIKNLKIKHEYVCLIVGREPKRYFRYEIPKQAKKVVVSDFFKNENYIVDPIGVIHLVEMNQHESIDYLYWIATNDKIDMTQEKELSEFKPMFIEFIHLFEKYHYRVMKLFIDDKSRVTIAKHKKIK